MVDLQLVSAVLHNTSCRSIRPGACKVTTDGSLQTLCRSASQLLTKHQNTVPLQQCNTGTHNVCIPILIRLPHAGLPLLGVSLPAQLLETAGADLLSTKQHALGANDQLRLAPVADNIDLLRDALRQQAQGHRLHVGHGAVNAKHQQSLVGLDGTAAHRPRSNQVSSLSTASALRQGNQGTACSRPLGSQASASVELAGHSAFWGWARGTVAAPPPCRHQDSLKPAAGTTFIMHAGRITLHRHLWARKSWQALPGALKTDAAGSLGWHSLLRADESIACLGSKERDASQSLHAG